MLIAPNFEQLNLRQMHSTGAAAAAHLVAHNIRHEEHLIKVRRERAAALAAQQAAQAAQAAQQQQVAAAPPAPAAPAAPAPPSGGGVLSAAQIGSLWLSEGGSPSAEMTAECIAEHESGGDPSAGPSPTDDFGLFQEHDRPDVQGNAALSTQVAIQMSANGTDWSPWTTAAGCGV